MSPLCWLFLWSFAALVVFSLIFGWIYWGIKARMSGATSVRMDPIDPDSGKPILGGFESHLSRYQDLAKLLLTLAAATIAFLVNFVASISVDNKRSIYSLKLERACPFSIFLLGLSAIFTIFFILWESLAYETYCHSKNRDTYSFAAYAANLAFGWSAFACFGFAYIYLAVRIFFI